MSLSLISKYRTELMGVAMLLVFFSHIPTPISNPVWNYCQWNGHFGVDMFVLLSGMGLYYSFQKDNNIKHFYTKRLIRILPFYCFINVLYLLTPSYAGNNNIWEILATITTVGYWFDYGYCDWFIPHLLLMYFSFPLFNYLISKFDNKINIVLVLLAWLVIWGIPISNDLFFRAAFRWIEFPLGIILGKSLYSKRDLLDIKSYMMVFVAVIGFLLSIFFYVKFSDSNLRVFDQPLYLKGYIYMPYFLIVIGFCYVLSVFFEYCSYCIKAKKLLLWGGQIVGRMSLELYLVHIWFVSYACVIYQQTRLTSMSLILLGIFILFSFPVAYVLHLLNKVVTNKLTYIFVEKTAWVK